MSYKKCADGNVTGWSDADWKGDMDDRHSTSGNMFSLAGGVVSCLSKKQAIFVLTTAQSRVWSPAWRHPRSNLKTIHEDNQGAIAMAKNSVRRARTKHNDIRYHFVHEIVQN